MPISKGVPMRTISQCGQCGESFNGMVGLKDHIKKVHIPERIIKFSKPVVDEGKNEQQKVEEKPVDVVKSPEPPKVPPPEPIVLEYRYKGQCSMCRHDVKTVMLDVDDYSFAVSYCSNCDKKLLQTKVIPISSQFKNEKTKL